LAGTRNSAFPVFWPADKIIIAYSVPMCAIELIWFHQIADAGWLLALHAIAIALLILAARLVEQRPLITSGPIWIFRHWYPLLYVACCYREMAMIIAGIRHNHADMALAAIDHAFWGVYPTVWLERLYSPGFTEFLQLIYTLFLPVALLVPLTIWLKGRFTEFRYMAFLLSLGFLVSYLGYLAVPAHGPRYALLNLQHLPLKGLWLFNWMQTTLNRLETDHYDCFPSGHTEITILACWLSRRISKRIFWAYFLYTLCIVFATVYLRYHYTCDLLAGVVVALVLILAAPRLYRVLSEKGASIGD
jgi:membrane-associated phospholipid phosphatase